MIQSHNPTCRCDLCRESARLRRIYEDRVKKRRRLIESGERPRTPDGAFLL